MALNIRGHRIALYPIFMKLEGRRCVVVGGGAVAARKVQSLVESGAEVRVVSPEICEELRQRAAEGEIEVVPREFAHDDLRGAALAIAATNHRAVNEAVLAAGRERGVLVNVVDVPDLCDFYVPSRLDRGNFQIAICTAGAFPALAKKTRLALTQQFGPEYADYMDFLQRFRQEAKVRVSDPYVRAQKEEAFLSAPILDLLVQGKRDEAEEILNAWIGELSS